MGGTTIKPQGGEYSRGPLCDARLCPVYHPSYWRVVLSVYCKQVWYADNVATASFISDNKEWWSTLVFHGPSYNYFVNNYKTWLVVKEDPESAAHDLFKNSSINFTTEGCPYQGAPIGTASFINEFISAKVKHWGPVLSLLNDISSSSPRATYTAFTHGIFNLWSFLCHTTPNICRASWESNLIQTDH